MARPAAKLKAGRASVSKENVKLDLTVCLSVIQGRCRITVAVCSGSNCGPLFIGKEFALKIVLNNPLTEPSRLIASLLKVTQLTRLPAQDLRLTRDVITCSSVGVRQSLCSTCWLPLAAYLQGIKVQHGSLTLCPFFLHCI
jgi:hypothetical protein